MDLDDLDPFEGPVHIPDQDSGSDYENSDSDFDQNHGNKSHDKTTSTGPSKSRNKQDKIIDVSSGGESDSSSDTPANQDQGNKYTAEWIRADAIKFAATFVPPNTEDIPAPYRRERKRKREQLPLGISKARRLKEFYSNEYRDLLNIDIHDAGKRSIHEDNTPLEASQIGCSIWSAVEKDAFFTGLSRIGRDNVKAIAALIGTKSEVEVQEYIQLLHLAWMEKKLSKARLLETTDLPAAAEITVECCTVMERSADAIAARQDLYEEGIEKRKWGEYWLLTKEVSRLIDKKDILQEAPPSVQLLDLKTWLALSEKVFMNSSGPRQEDNWRQVGEGIEKPAIRATAFEDFHSLTVSVTKRLISTTLFCAMSRIRGLGLAGAKRAGVTANDVEAATNILKMEANSNDFWIQCPKRNTLAVFDIDEKSIIPYEEVEAELRKPYEVHSQYWRINSRERSQTPHIRYSEPPLQDNDTSSEDSFVVDELPPSDDYSESDSHSQHSDNPSTQMSRSRSQTPSQAWHSPRSYEHALEAHISLFDSRASALEEQRIWRLLGQDPPFQIGGEEDELPGKPRGRVDLQGEFEGIEWRKGEFWSEWEGMNGLVGKEEFEKNKLKMERRRGRGRDRAEERRRGKMRSEEYVVESNSEDEDKDEVEDEDGEADEFEKIKRKVERRRGRGRDRAEEKRRGKMRSKEYAVESNSEDEDASNSEDEDEDEEASEEQVSDVEDMGVIIGDDEMQDIDEDAEELPIRQSYAVYNSDDE